MNFSQRQGLKNINQIMQIDDIDKELKNALWNVITRVYLRLDNPYNKNLSESLFNEIWHSFLKEPIDERPQYWSNTYDMIKKLFFEIFLWNEIYDFVEFLPNNYDLYKEESVSIVIADLYKQEINKVLERENSAYRFVDDCIVQITSEEEIKSIESIIDIDCKYFSVQTHIKTALKHLSDKKNPDYRNSIKESISGVESMCKIITQLEKVTLGEALKIMNKDHNYHSAFLLGMEKIYGFTSDSQGIRHSLLDESNLDYSDALYMLISCSAFINYLMYKSKS